MATRFYFHAATDSTSGLPTTEQSSLTQTLRADALTLNRSMNTTIGTADVTIELIDPATDQEAVPAYLSRWVSPPLDQTSISANTWTINFATQDHSAVGERYPVSGSAPARVNLYVWRPSNSTNVGTVLDGNTGNITNADDHPNFYVHHTTFSGSAVSNVQTGDVLICELWLPAVSMEAGQPEAFSLNFDGTTANTTNNANVTSNPSHASFVETPENLTFSGGTTTVTQTSIHKYDLRQNIAQTSIQKYDLRQYIVQTSVHKYDLRYDVVQTSIHKYDILTTTSVTQTTIHKYNLLQNVTQTTINKYDLRAYLAQTSIHKYDIQVTATGPTRLYFHAAASGVSGTLPSTEQSTRTSSNDVGPQSTNRSMNTTIGTGQTAISGNTVVTSLLDIYFTKFVSDPLNVTSIAANTWTYNFAYLSSNISSNFPAASGSPGYVNCYVWRPSNGTTVGTIRDGTTGNLTEAIGLETVQHTTFTGSAVSNIQAGDVIIIEIWFRVSSSGSGATTPVDWYYDGTTVNTTHNSQSSTNHASFIETPEGITFGEETTTVTQTSVHKYDIRQNVAQASIQKYDIQTINYVTQTSIQKYDIRQNITQSSIHKYNLRTFVAITSLIQKYNLIQNILQTSIQKYNVVQIIGQTSLHKYNIGGRTIATSIHKYNIGLAGSIDMTNTNTKTYSNKFIVKV